MKKTYKKIAIIGGGVMGTILVRALVDTNSAKKIVVCEKNTSHHKKLRDISSSVQATDNYEDCIDAGIVFLAIKPQDFSLLKLNLNKQTLVCSIMAGVPISKISIKLKNNRIIRMMPNIAARVGQGFTVWTATPKVSALEKKWIKNFLTKMGDQLYVNTEQKIDKATAITGSGPAYIFNTLSVFAHATQHLGFKKKEAYRMVHQVLRGVEALSNTNSKFEYLTQQVTSKGGTTEAALQVFENSNLKKIWVSAVNAAYKRAKKLS